MENINVLQIVGYKNSGKTTLITAWIKELAKRNRRAAVIKHHGHGGELEQPPSTTDSIRCLNAGAVSTLAYGNQLIQLHMHEQQPTLSTLFEISKLSNPDVILIEGFKSEDYPKVVIVRDSLDWLSLCKLTNIVGVIGHEGTVLEEVSYITRNDVQAVNALLFRQIGGDVHETV